MNQILAYSCYIYAPCSKSLAYIGVIQSHLEKYVELDVRLKLFIWAKIGS